MIQNYEYKIRYISGYLFRTRIEMTKKTTNLKKADKYHKHHEMQRKFLGPSLRKMIQNYEYKIRYISGYLFKRE